MPRDFYKQGDSYYYTDNDQKILNLSELQQAAQAGGTEVANPENLSSFVDTTSQGNIEPQMGIDDTITGTSSLWDNYFSSTAASGMTSAEQGIASLLQQQESAAASDIATTESAREAALLNLETAYDMPSGEDLLKGLMGEYKIEEKLSKLSEFQTQLAQLERDYASVKSQIGSKPINAAIIRGQQFLKKEEFAADATFISSKASIVKNELDAAQSIVSSYYDASMADRQSEIIRYTNLFDLHDKELIRLDKEEQDAIDKQLSLMLEIDKRQKEDKDKMMELLAEYPGAWEKSKIDLTKSIEFNLKEMLPYMYEENMRREQVRYGGKSGSAAGKIPGLTEEEKRTYETAYNLAIRQDAGNIPPEQWWAEVDKFMKETGITDRGIADAMLKNKMTEIQNTFGFGGAADYGEEGEEDDPGSDLYGILDKQLAEKDYFHKGKKGIPNWMRYGGYPAGASIYGLDWLGTQLAKGAHWSTQNRE